MEHTCYWEHPGGQQMQNLAHVRFTDGGLFASGEQVGPGYASRWILDAEDNRKTRTVHVQVTAEGWTPYWRSTGTGLWSTTPASPCVNRQNERPGPRPGRS